MPSSTCLWQSRGLSMPKGPPVSKYGFPEGPSSGAPFSFLERLLMARESPTLFVNTALAALFVLSCVILVIRWWTVPSGFGHLQHRAWKGVWGRGSAAPTLLGSRWNEFIGRKAAERAWGRACSGLRRCVRGAALEAVELMGIGHGSSGEVTRRAYVTRGCAGRPY